VLPNKEADRTLSQSHTPLWLKCM